jgi:hypothetical protein
LRGANRKVKITVHRYGVIRLKLSLNRRRYLGMAGSAALFGCSPMTSYRWLAEFSALAQERGNQQLKVQRLSLKPGEWMKWKPTENA